MKTNMAKGIMMLASVAAVATMTAAPAQAGKKQFCKRYARIATSQYYRAIDLECNYSGAYWHPAKNLHKLWCMGQPRHVAEDGNDYRAQKLSICQAQGEN